MSAAKKCEFCNRVFKSGRGFPSHQRNCKTRPATTADLTAALKRSYSPVMLTYWVWEEKHGPEEAWECDAASPEAAAEKWCAEEGDLDEQMVDIIVFRGVEVWKFTATRKLVLSHAL